MIRIALVYLTVMGALAGVMSPSGAYAQTPHVLPMAEANVGGRWVGRYICGQGVTRLELDIRQETGGKISATFNFGPAPENPKVPKGAFAMRGTFDAKTGRMKIGGVTWINQPDGYGMVDLDGYLSADGDRLNGIVPFFGCTVFDLKRAAPLIG